MRLKIGTLLGLFILMATNLSAQTPKQEVRAVWIATVNHIDWPVLSGTSAEVQQKELLALLDCLVEKNFNTVIFQVRPASDAFYQSKTEPWSAWLSGKQGQEPDDNWDPLRFIIEECHKRGMELHAWFNPFRITQNEKDYLAPNNIAKKHPEWALSYNHKIVLDPGIPYVGDYIVHVVEEVVSEYDIDAVHFDDYFYPYPTNDKKDFPDTASFRLYNRGYSAKEKDTWRRENVDLIIERLSKTIKNIKPYIKFGISPFGVWRNYAIDTTGSATSSNITNYDDLYADVIRWQKQKWIDYLMPQIYWEVGHPNADYKILCDWWANHNYGRHVYIGLAGYKASESQSGIWCDPKILESQIDSTRRNDRIQGTGIFRIAHIMENKNGWMDSISSNLFQNKALIPSMPWIDNIAPEAPDRVQLKNDLIFWTYRKAKVPADIKEYIIYYSRKRDIEETQKAENIAIITKSNSFHLEEINAIPGETIFIWISAIDRQNNESAPSGPFKYKMRTQ